MSRSLEMNTIRLILKYRELGYSVRDVASAANCSKNTVTLIIKMAANLNIDYQKSNELKDDELKEKFYPNINPYRDIPEPDVDAIIKELKNKHVTIKQLHEEYLAAYPHGLQYTQFCERIREKIMSSKITMHIEKKAGEKCEIDWSGDPVYYVDSDTGKKVACSVLVTVLGRSGYPYMEAFPDRTKESFITGVIHAITYYGRAPKILVPDNDKSAVTSHKKYEVILNSAFEEMAEYYGIAIVPARVRRPQDKSVVEKTVFDLAERELLGKGRNEIFSSLEDINKYIKKLLFTFSNKPFSNKSGTRYSQFMEEDYPEMKELPSIPYEIKTHKLAKVAPNYHIEYDKFFYSVPFIYLGKEVEVIASRNIVDIYCNHEKIASHQRNYNSKSKYTTLVSHMPPNHQFGNNMNQTTFKNWAKTISEDTYKLVVGIFNGRHIEEQCYKPCLGLMSLAKKNLKLFKEAVSFAVENDAYNYKFVNERFKFLESKPVESIIPNSNTRGPSYYAVGGSK